MAKKKTKKTAIASEDLRRAVARFTKQGDRGTAIMAAAWIDSALEAALVAFFPGEEELMQDLLQPEGPMGTFAARIKLAYLLHIIPPSLARDLEIIRRIRNEFAHAHSEVRFTDQSLRDRCSNLVGAQAYAAGWGETIRSNRQKFILSAYFATEWLLAWVQSARNKKRPVLLDVYGTVIHRTAKHASLEAMLEFLKKQAVRPS